MKTVALVTEMERPALSQSDSLLVEPLQAQGIYAAAVPWDAPDVDWRAFDAVVLRSCWLYHQQVARFAAWIDTITQEGARLWNPAPAVRWNLDKRYLGALAAREVPVVPTVWLEQGEQVELAALLQAQGWSAAVVKPRIGASAFHIWQTSQASAIADQPRFQATLGKRAVMVQPLVREIADGEWSLVFFQGTFSHAVLKRPERGGIFVQPRLGGVSEPALPTPALVRQAAGALEAAAQIIGMPLLYARVDGVLVEGRLCLMELELIEPGLFLPTDPSAAARFARAIAEVIQADPAHGAGVH
jgi:hypothetical protein